MDNGILPPRTWGENTKPAVLTTLGEPCEPFGELSFFKMIDVFYDKAYALDEENCTSFVLEGIEELSELRAALIACRQFDKPVIAVLEIDSEADETVGGKELGYLMTLQSMGLDMIGFKADPEESPEDSEKLFAIVREIMKYSSIPLYIKLDENNAFPVYLKQFEGFGEKVFDVTGLDSRRLELVRQVISELPELLSLQEDISFVAANHNQAFFLNPEHITFSPPVDIECDMADELIDFDDECYDVVIVEINSHDDGFRLSQNLHWLELPVMFRADTPEALRMALCYYNGRALVDSECPIGDDRLKEIADEFGAIIY